MSKSYGNYIGVPMPRRRCTARRSASLTPRSPTGIRCCSARPDPALARATPSARWLGRWLSASTVRARAAAEAPVRPGPRPPRAADDIREVQWASATVSGASSGPAGAGLRRSRPPRRATGPGAVRLDGEPVEGRPLDMPVGEVDGARAPFGKRGSRASRQAVVTTIVARRLADGAVTMTVHGGMLRLETRVTAKIIDITEGVARVAGQPGPSGGCDGVRGRFDRRRDDDGVRAAEAWRTSRRCSTGWSRSRATTSTTVSTTTRLLRPSARALIGPSESIPLWTGA